MKFSTLNRTARLLLLAMLASVVLTACGESADVTTETTAGSDTAADTTPVETEEALELPAKDWEGREFRVLGYRHASRTQFSNFEIDTEAENGEVVNDAIYRRNVAIEDRYNVKITEYPIEAASYNTTTGPHIRQTVLAGDDLYDLAFTTISAGTIGSLAREGMFYDLNEVDYIDFEKSWWNKDVNDTLEMGGRLFFTTSDFSLRDKSRAYIMTYNKDKVEEYKLGNLIELIDNGKWTLDVFGEWSKAVANDTNGNSEADEGDAFGFGTDSYVGVMALMYGGDLTVLGRDDSGNPKLIINNEHTIDVVEKVVSLSSQSDIAVIPNEWQGRVAYDYWSTSGNFFYAGNLLFRTSFPHALASLSEKCEFDYGVIPFPKFDEKQEKYWTYADEFCMLFGIPSSCADPDFAGFMLEALSHEATDTSLNAYYEVACKVKYTYDEDSARMLDLTFDGIRYEPAVVYNIAGAGTLLYNVAVSGENTFASSYASIESTAVADISKMLEDLANIGK